MIQISMSKKQKKLIVSKKSKLLTRLPRMTQNTKNAQKIENEIKRRKRKRRRKKKSKKRGAIKTFQMTILTRKRRRNKLMIHLLSLKTRS